MFYKPNVCCSGDMSKTGKNNSFKKKKKRESEKEENVEHNKFCSWAEMLNRCIKIPLALEDVVIYGKKHTV